MKKQFILISVLMLAAGAYAQVGIGIDKNHKAAILHMKSDKSGVLIPNVTLQSLTDKATLAVDAKANSLLVFNTNTGTGVFPGYYFWLASQNKWQRLTTQKELDDAIAKVTLEIDSKIDAVKAEVEQKLSVINNKITNLDNKYTELKNQFDAFKTEVDTKITNLEASLNQKIDNFKTEINNKFDAFKTEINNKIANLEASFNSKITKIEGDITKIENKLAKASSIEYKEVKASTTIAPPATDSVQPSVVVYFVSPENNEVTITLPEATNKAFTGKKLTIKKADADNDKAVKVTGTLEGSLTELYTTLPYSGWDLLSNGKEWKIINKF